ncbi:MAG: metallophosphoesterase [Oscillospiraceae bacterium]|nr:metallophosphoesterase [Oscillospiraceae bacterium]
MLDKLTAWFLTIYMAFGGVIPLPIRIKITAEPAVMIVSQEEYTVMWATNRRGSGWLTVTAQGREQTFYDSSSGTIRSDDKLHVARVPKEVLDNCDSYRVHSQYTLINFGYFAIKGKQTASKEYAFRGYRGEDTVRALFFADIHGNQAAALANAATLQADADAAPNLVILAGDIPADGLLFQRDFIDDILSPAAKLSGGTIPVLYCRGNHEARGQWATELRRYFPTDTGELYFTASYGPISFTVLDTGEDKDDGHHEYAGLADFAAYRARQFSWLNELPLDTSESYGYRICVSHMQNLNREGMFDDWYAPLRDQLEITHIFCGHGHNNNTWENGGLRHYEDGSENIGSMLTFHGGEIFAKSAAVNGEIRDFGKLE